MRKRVLSLILVLSMLLAYLPGVPAADAAGVTDLIPDEANVTTPNYVCTWSNQDWTALSSDADKAVSSSVPRDMLNHEQLFDPETGWCYTAYQDSKQDLIFLLDDGWDLPYSSNGSYMSYFSSFLLDEAKFPGYGDTPQERLKTLVDNIEGAGWKGAGVWVCADTHTEDYWRERLEWSAYAGVDYWKIDWGSGSGSDSWRQMISNLADEIAPDLVIEHIVGYSTLNTSADGGTRMSDSVAQASADRGSYADVYRTYDVNGNLSIATTFERIGKHLQYAYTDGRQLGLVNGEDEVYMCSALGLIFGVMRYDIGDASSGSLPNIFFGGAEDFTESRPIRKMLDEVQRATMWQRIAPAYRADAYKTVISEEALADSWIYSSEDTWDTGTCGAGSGSAKTQKAPAVIARGIDMPVVTADAQGFKPFVAVSRNPNGAISIGTYGRTTPNKGYQAIYSDITLDAGDLTGKIGVFGYYDSLTLTFNQDLRGKTIYAQDMMDNMAAEDITDEVTLSADGKSVTFSGELLARVGLAGATEDYSEPGLVIQIGDEADFAEAPETIATSLIPNGSFEYTVSGENGKADPRNWTETANSSNVYVEEGNAKNGESYLVLKQNAGASATATIPNGIYNVSAWVRSEQLSGTAAMTVSGYGGENVEAVISASGEWTQFLIENVSVTGGKLTVAFTLNGGEGDYIHVDVVDLSICDDVDLIAELVETALTQEEGTNEMTADVLLAMAEQTLWAYEGSGITVTVSDFVLVPGSDSDNGFVTATVTVSNGSEEASVSVKLIIPKTQVVYNPSFEIGSTVNGDAPQGWDIWAADGYDVNSFCYVESKSDWMGGAHTGSWYGSTWGLKFECSTSQTVSVPNGKYNVSVWVQNTAFTGTDYTDTGCAGYFGVKAYGGKTRFVALDEAHSEWTKLVIEDVVVTTGKIELGMYLNNDTGKEQWVKFDDFAVEPVASSIVLADMKNGTVELSRTEAIPGAQVTVNPVPASQYRLIEGTLKVYKTNDPRVSVSVSDGVFTMPGYSVTVEAKFEPATPQTYQFLPVEKLTGIAESWTSKTPADYALDGDTTTNWHSNHNQASTPETEDNHFLLDVNGNQTQDNGGADKPLGKYNNYYIILDEAMSVDKVSIYALWNGNVTNGTAKEVKVYVSGEDYTENRNIEWGESVGSSPEGGFTYSANDLNKIITFDEPQHNVKTIRIEFLRTYANGGGEINKWIRVMEFGVSAKETEEEVDVGPEVIDKSRLTGYAESWQSGGGAENALDGDTWSNWHSMYSGTETDDNHITEDANGKHTVDGGGVPMAKYNNYYIVIDEPATVENISIHGKWDNGITNGTVKKCNIYVSSEDYSSNKDIDWGEAVGSSPESGFTYTGADDMKKLVRFAEAQENVKSIRIEVTETYSGAGHKESKWIRVTEFDLNEWIVEEPEIPGLPEEDPLYTIVAVADYHTDYGIEVGSDPVRDTVRTTMERIAQEENANAIVALGDLISANDTSHWFAGSAADREAIYNKAIEAMYNATESGMDDPMVMYVAGNHDTEIGCKDFNSHSFVEDGTERTMGEMVAAKSVTDVEANAYFETDLTGVLNDPAGERNVLAYHYNVDGLDFIALNPPYIGQRNTAGVCEYDEGALEWVSNKMAAIGKDKTVILMGHYPIGTDFRNTDSSSVTAKTEQLLRAILKEYPNTIYLYGHVHDDYIDDDTYEAIVAYEDDAATIYTDRYSAPTGFISAFAGSMGYFGYSAGLVPQGGLTAKAPNYVQALMVYIYADRIVFQMKNYGAEGGELEPYTVMRSMELTPVLNTSRLEALIAEADALEERKFEAEGWQALQEVLEQARQLLAETELSQSRINKTANLLSQTIEQLIPRDTTMEDLAMAMEIVAETKKLAEETAALAEAARADALAAQAAAREARKEAEEIIDISGENSEAAVAAAKAAEAAQKRAEDAAARAEEAQANADTAAEAAELAAAAAESANLEAAANALQAAKDALSAAGSQAKAAAAAAEAAENAVLAAQAQKAAQEAKNKADQAKADAEEAQARAEKAQADADAAAETVAEDTAAIQAAKEAAEQAKQIAEAAAADAKTAQAAADAAAQAAEQAMDQTETASNEAMQQALLAAKEAKSAAEASAEAARQAAIVAGYAAEAAAAQRAAQEAQARAEQARKDAEEAAKKAEQERLEAEAAQKAAEAEADAAKLAAELETAKQAALARILLYTDSVDISGFDEEKWEAYNTVIFDAMDAVEASEDAAGANAAVEDMIARIGELTAVHECFEDVDPDAWYHEAVDYVFENGHMIGMTDKLFDPTGKLTRAQFATILHRLEGEPEVEYTAAFTDVPEDQWYTDSILWAAESGVVLGYDNGSFGVNDIITREQMIVMLARYAQAQAEELSDEFADRDMVSTWAADAMGWAVSAGLIKGSSDPNGLNLNPQGSTTRAECAAIIQRFLESMAN